MADQDRPGCTKVVADFEASDPCQREFAKERMHPLTEDGASAPVSPHAQAT